MVGAVTASGLALLLGTAFLLVIHALLKGRGSASGSSLDDARLMTTTLEHLMNDEEATLSARLQFPFSTRVVLYRF